MAEKNDDLREQAIKYFGGRERPFALEELAKYLGVSRFTVLRYRQAGVLHAFVRGRVVRFHVEHVYRFLMSQTV